MKGSSVCLTARDSVCTSHHGLGGGTHIKLAEVIIANMTMLVLFEETSNFFNVRLFNVPRLAWVGKRAVLSITFATFSRVIGTEHHSQFLWEDSSQLHGRVLDVKHTHF